MKTLCTLILISLTAFTCLQCSKVTESSDINASQGPIDLTAAKQKVVSSSNRFGMNLFRELTANSNPDSNVYFSPLSVSYALGMTYNGAADETREAMAATLEYGDLTTVEINASYQSLMEILVAAGIVTPDGAPVQRPAEAELVLPTQQGSEAGRIWTPDSDRGDSRESKIWVPDAD